MQLLENLESPSTVQVASKQRRGSGGSENRVSTRLEAARWSGVSPDSSTASTEAPSSNNFSVSAKSPADAASCSGVCEEEARHAARPSTSSSILDCMTLALGER